MLQTFQVAQCGWPREPPPAASLAAAPLPPPPAPPAPCCACRMYKLYELKQYALLYCLPAAGIAEVKLSPGLLLLLHERRPASIGCQLLSLPEVQVGGAPRLLPRKVQRPARRPG